MKRVLILILIFFSISYSQSRTRNYIPKRIKLIEPEQNQLLKWQKFNAENRVSWNLRWNKHTGIPASIFGKPVFAGKGDAITVGKSFLSNNMELFKIGGHLNNLKIIKIDERRNKHVTFQQMFEGLIVILSHMIILINEV